MINFTVGPVQCDSETLAIGSEQVPYFRTAEFSAIMKQNETLVCNFFDAPKTSRVVFMTGSGTASMEALVMNLFTNEDKVLVVNGGTFGARLSELCKIHEIPFEEIKLRYGENLTKETLSKYEGKNYNAMLLQLCETSTGILYDLEMIGEFCKRNNIFLAVDAISGFLADEFSMQKMNVSAAITGSQKALALPPGLSIIALDEKAVARIQKNEVKSLYFNLNDYLENGERGQTPFTPAVQILLQLNEKLLRIEKQGGIKIEQEKIKFRAEYFRNRIKNLNFVQFVSGQNASNCVTSLQPKNPALSAYRIFEILKNEHGIWVCPNGGELRDSVFRVGHIGNIKTEDIDALIFALETIQKNAEIQNAQSTTSPQAERYVGSKRYCSRV